MWNEPNLKAFWTGGKKGYYELYRTTAQAIKNIDPQLKVGGPSSAQNAWIPDFLEHCEKNELPVADAEPLDRAKLGGSVESQHAAGTS